MILTHDNVLLFIEPRNQKTDEPNNDKFTLFVENLFNNAYNDSSKHGVVLEDGEFFQNVSTKGHHVCKCGERSHPHDYKIADMMYTNSLAVHYLRWHRIDVTVSEVKKIEFLMNQKIQIGCTK